jgi:ATP-dependent DNA helicase RecG
LTLRLGAVSTPVTEHSSETSSERYAERVKELMRRDSKITQKNLAVILGVSDRWVEKITKKLRESGDIRRKGGRFGGEWEVLK